jgi:phosphoribosylglycinamide formyltransferase-1
MMQVGVLASGSGSNFQALVEGLVGSQAQVCVMIGNVAGARVFDRAASLGVPTLLMEHGKWPTREAFDSALVAELKSRGVDLVCLAGYMRLVTPTFLRAFPRGVINVHPALLPSFKGLHGARQALTAGVRLTGCTVHLVDEGTDTGPIIAQAAVPVLPADDEASLSARIQQQEHRLFPLVVRAIAEGRVRVERGVVTLQEWVG